MTDFDRLADELYAATPDAFIAARDECVKQARANGEAELARALAKLRRPTQSAWLVNLLARDDASPLEDLLGLVDSYTAALAERDAGRLKELTSERRQLERRLVTRAAELGDDAGIAPSDAALNEVRATLDAAVSDPEVADQVRAGRLVKAVAPSWSGGTAVPVPSKPNKVAKRPEAKPPKASKVDDAGAARAAADEREAQAEREAAASVERERAEAQDALDERTAEADRTNSEYEQLSDRLEQLRAEARELAQQVSTARQVALRAERRRAQAKRQADKLGEALPP